MNLSEQVPPKIGLRKMATTVMASFLGIRRRSDYESDAASISLKQVIIAGIVGGIIFVIGVILLVKVVLATLTSTG